jgi:D-alanyl-D-alanine carboxypeptidase (penicillin-binding protein 5/6)
LVVKGGAVLATARVWKGQFPSVDLGIKDDLYITLPRGETDVRTAADVQPRLIAPLALDAAVGTLHVSAGTQTLATLPLHPLKNVPAGGWWRRLIDTIRLWFVKA